MKIINSSCIEKIYCIDTDDKQTIVDSLSSYIHDAELALMKSEHDIILLSNRKHKGLKRITDDLFIKIDEMEL